MRKKRAVTLVELLISIAMIGILVLAISSTGASLYAMKKNVLDKQAPSVQAQLALATIFERVLRATLTTAGPQAAFTISNGGTKVSYKLSGHTEDIWWDTASKNVYYNDGVNTRTILRGVHSLNFAQTSNDLRRLEIDVTSANGEKHRTAVQPRNVFTTGIIN